MITKTHQLEPRNWVATHADYLYAYAIARINDEEQAKDLVQETFLAALQKVDKFEGKSSERTWLTAILKYKIIDVYRKKSSGFVINADMQGAEQKESDFFEPQYGHWRSEHAPMTFGIDDHDPLVNMEFNSILQKCMQKLPVLWLSIFTMKHMDDQSTDVICSELKVTQSNFWVIIHRTKLNLRACLQKNWI
jgi:RNA polymerase sigma-70 factor (TIGR02943 family)